MPNDHAKEENDSSSSTSNMSQQQEQQPAGQKRGGRSLGAYFSRRLRFITGEADLRPNKEMIIGGVIVLAFIVVAIAIAIGQALHISVTPYDIYTQSGPTFGAPTLAHPMGTDNLGRDQLSRILYATPNAMVIGFAVVGFSLVLGIVVGAFAGFHGGLFDEALMRVTDIFFAIPALILAIAIVAAIGASLWHVLIGLMIVWWPAYARLARGETLKVAHSNYIEASRMSGFRSSRIIFRHVLPNIFIILLVYATLDIGTVIVFYSGLSYLGLSVPPPQPDWGFMLQSFGDALISAPWLPLFPGLLIALAAVGFSIFGDGFRDAVSGS